MRTWQYKITNYPSYDIQWDKKGSSRYVLMPGHDKSIKEDLNEMGKAGWELVSVVYYPPEPNPPIVAGGNIMDPEN